MCDFTYIYKCTFHHVSTRDSFWKLYRLYVFVVGYLGNFFTQYISHSCMSVEKFFIINIKTILKTCGGTCASIMKTFANLFNHFKWDVYSIYFIIEREQIFQNVFDIKKLTLQVTQNRQAINRIFISHVPDIVVLMLLKKVQHSAQKHRATILLSQKVCVLLWRRKK